MKIKRFTLLTLSAIACSIALLLLSNSPEAKYFPRQGDLDAMHTPNGYMDYIAAIKANQITGEIDPADVFAAERQASKLSKGNKALGINWSFKGPDNVGGRTRAFLIDRNNPDHLYVGGVAGGVFESFDAGQNWTPYDPNFTVKNISCITQGSDGAIYVGTGGHFEGPNIGRTYFFLGSGVHKLTGNGNFETIVAPNSRLENNIDFATVGNITADPLDAKRLYVAMNNGFRIIDMSTSPATITDPIKFNRKANDVDATADGKLLVSYQGGDLYVSHDRGIHFFKNSFPKASRVECAIAPSNSNVMYASMAAKDPGALPFRDCLYGIFQSINGGITWKRISPEATSSFNMMGNPGVNCAGGWHNAIAVFPDNQGKIVVGGVTLYKWEQSSVEPAPVNGSWNQIDVTNEFFPNGSRNDFYSHVDKHRIVFDPRNSNTVYLLSDGGVYKSFDFNNPIPTYRAYNKNYGVTQFYNLGVGPNDIVLAGAQDNNSHLIGLQFNNNRSGFDVLSGDGFDADMSVVNPSIGFASSQFNGVRRIQGIGTTSGNSNISVADVVGANAFLGGLCGTPEGCNTVFYTCTKLWESFNHVNSPDSVTLFLETTHAPPYKAGTSFTYKSSNSSDVRLIEQTYAIPNDEYAIDTLNGIDEVQRTSLSDGISFTFIANYDTITVDTVNKTLFFKYRDNRPNETKSYVINTPVNYTNAFVGPLNVLIKRNPRGFQDSIIYHQFQLKFVYQFPAPDHTQTIFATSNWPGQGSDYTQRNIYITRDMMRNKPDIKWFSIAGQFSTPDPIISNVISMEFSRDGNYLFAGTIDGKLYRISDLNGVSSKLPASSFGSWYNIQNNQMAGKCRIIGSFAGRSVTDIAVDPNNSDNVIVSLGNYGNGYFVARTTTATTAIDALGTFTPIQGVTSELPKAPAYAVMIDVNNPNKVLVGNELGIFGTENAFETTTATSTVTIPADTTYIAADTVIVPADSIVTTDTTVYIAADTTYIAADTIIRLAQTTTNTGADVIWTEESVGMGRVPVFDLEQMVFDYTKAGNSGKVYAATHGRGIFETDNFVGLPKVEHNVYKESFKSSLKFYPNPASNNAKVEFNLSESGSVRLMVYDIRGKLLKDETIGSLNEGKNTLPIGLDNLSNGTYIVRLMNGAQVATTKFIVHK